MNLKDLARRNPGRAKWLLRGGVALLVYTLAGFFLLPAIIKWQMLKHLPAATKRQATIEKVKLNPYALSLTIRGLSLKETDGTPFASWQELYVNFQLSSLLRRAWVFKEISLKQPLGQITLQTNGTLNFANMFDASPPAPKPAAKQAIPRVIIDLLHIDDGALSFTDRTRPGPFNTRFAPINIRLAHFTTRPGTDNPYSFTASTGARDSFQWSGDFSLEPLASAGNFRLSGLVIKNYSPYLQDFARVAVLDGKLDVEADYRLSATANGLSLAVSNAAVRLSALQLQATDTGETVLSIPSFLVEHAEANLLEKTARVRSIKSSGGSILARQNADGTINLLSMLNQRPAKSPGTNTNASEVPFTVTLDDISIENYAIHLEDRKLAKPARIEVDQLSLKLQGLSTRTNVPIVSSVSLRLNETGTVRVAGTALLFPPAADLEINLEDLSLPPFQPYVEEQLKLSLTSGRLNAQLRAHVAPSEAPMVKLTGQIELTNFATLDQVAFQDFVKWDSLSVRGINVQMLPTIAQVDEVKWVGLHSGLIIGTNQRPNLEAILAKGPPQPATNLSTVGTNTPVAPAPEIPVKLATLILSNASFHFSDQSLQPHCNFEIKAFNATITGLSSERETTATVDVRGNVDERAPFSVAGKINPLSKDLVVDLTISLTNTDLTAFTPYLEKFGGYPLQKGKLSLGLRYEIAQQQVQAQNGVFVDQFTLGPKNNSPDATHLPVKLAVALLKDREGRIQLDLPIKGRLDDPQFSIGPIILKVFLNVLTKAVTSPFALLGAMFGGGEELSFIAFAPGTAELPAAEVKKLDTLSKALQERPALTLEIVGSSDPGQDREALSWLRFTQSIKKLRMAELAAKGTAPPSLGEVLLTAKDYPRLLKLSYKQVFGRRRPVAPSAAASISTDTNTPTPSATLLGIVRKVNFKSPSESSTHGAELLAAFKPAAKPAGTGSVPSDSAKPDASPAPAASSAAIKRPSPLPAFEADDEILAQMEKELREAMKITDADLVDLMEERARKVKGYLLDPGNVAPERLFLIAPKPLDSTSKGEPRANLSLN